MRLVMVAAPEDTGDIIANLAFSVGIKSVSRRQVTSQKMDGKRQTKDVVDIETSTPKAKLFIDNLIRSDFYKQEDFTISVRQPHSIISSESIEELTRPLKAPLTDVFEEKWQFSQITYGFVMRVFIAGCLLAFGLIQQQILLIIAGLLFLQMLPTLLAAAFGVGSQQWKLTGQGMLAFLTATVLLILAGALVAAVSSPPLRFAEFNSLTVSVLISLAVGVAAGLAVIDDAGRRELIGLAAAAQTAIIPSWFGICLVFGFPNTTGDNEILLRLLTFFVNFLAIIAGSLTVYFLTGTVNDSISRIKNK